MRDDLERLVLEKHQLLDQRGQLAGIICAVLRTRGGKLTLPKSAFVEGDGVTWQQLKGGTVTLTLVPGAKPAAEEPVKQPRPRKVTKPHGH